MGTRYRGYLNIPFNDLTITKDVLGIGTTSKFVCVCVCVHVRMSVCIHVHVFVRVCVHTYVCMHV